MLFASKITSRLCTRLCKKYIFHCFFFRNGTVPDVILTTIEIPESLQITGRGCFLQAQVCRTKKDLKSESNAKEISDGLPFLEYDLHKLLINKLKTKGMNAIFGLKVNCLKN